MVKTLVGADDAEPPRDPLMGVTQLNLELLRWLDLLTSMDRRAEAEFDCSPSPVGQREPDGLAARRVRRERRLRLPARRCGMNNDA